VKKEYIKFYKEYGWVIIRNFLKKKKIEEMKSKLIEKTKHKSEFFYYETIKKKEKLRRIEKVTDFSKDIKKILCSKKNINLIDELEQGKHTLFKDKLNFKFPGGKGYLPHIDGHFFWKDKNKKYQDGWKKYSSNFINLVLPLEVSNKKNGCIYVANKSDTDKLGKTFSKVTKKLVLNTPNIKKIDKKKFNFIPIELNIGDIFFFNWKCAHFSENNLSKNSRMIFYATFCKKNKNKNLRKLYYYDKQNSHNNIKNKSLLFT
jgi:ectoine hydroxylase-related dioxygenase (phytanoyl-CoA dioxygenase family)|tara:strand:- start:493 stop:1272 length:780 start_codon:yes stop_codon:yes gene_type:complete